MTVLDHLSCSRRAFVQRVLGLGVGLTALTSSAGWAKCLAEYRPKRLTEPELMTVMALMARLIPADGKMGGALEACAYRYLDQALGTHHARHLDAYRNGLRALDATAREQSATAFAELAFANMDKLITHMQRGELQGKFSDGGAAFFEMIRKHTLEGFLSDPMYGGNKDFLGWQVIGYNGVQLIYPPGTQQLNGRDTREQRSIAAFGGSPLL